MIRDSSRSRAVSTAVARTGASRPPQGVCGSQASACQPVKSTTPEVAISRPWWS